MALIELLSSFTENLRVLVAQDRSRNSSGLTRRSVEYIESLELEFLNKLQLAIITYNSNSKPRTIKNMVICINRRKALFNLFERVEDNFSQEVRELNLQKRKLWQDFENRCIQEVQSEPGYANLSRAEILKTKTDFSAVYANTTLVSFGFKDRPNDKDKCFQFIINEFESILAKIAADKNALNHQLFVNTINQFLRYANQKETKRIDKALIEELRKIYQVHFDAYLGTAFCFTANQYDLLGTEDDVNFLLIRLAWTLLTWGCLGSEDTFYSFLLPPIKNTKDSLAQESLIRQPLSYYVIGGPENEILISLFNSEENYWHTKVFSNTETVPRSLFNLNEIQRMAYSDKRFRVHYKKLRVRVDDDPPISLVTLEKLRHLVDNAFYPSGLADQSMPEEVFIADCAWDGFITSLQELDFDERARLFAQNIVLFGQILNFKDLLNKVMGIDFSLDGQIVLRDQSIGNKECLAVTGQYLAVLVLKYSGIAYQFSPRIEAQWESLVRTREEYKQGIRPFKTCYDFAFINEAHAIRALKLIYVAVFHMKSPGIFNWVEFSSLYDDLKKALADSDFSNANFLYSQLLIELMRNWVYASAEQKLKWGDVPANYQKLDEFLIVQAEAAVLNSDSLVYELIQMILSKTRRNHSLNSCVDAMVERYLDDPLDKVIEINLVLAKFVNNPELYQQVKTYLSSKPWTGDLILVYAAIKEWLVHRITAMIMPAIRPASSYCSSIFGNSHIDSTYKEVEELLFEKNSLDQDLKAESLYEQLSEKYHIVNNPEREKTLKLMEQFKDVVQKLPPEGVRLRFVSHRSPTV